MTVLELPPAVPSWPELTGTDAIGFRSIEAVTMAAAYWPSVASSRRPLSPEAVTDQGSVERALVVAPGSIQIRVTDPRSSDGPDNLDDGDEWEIDDGQGSLFDVDNLDGGPVVTEFSPAARRRLGRTVASVDWTQALQANLGGRLAMVTLTYPGDWRAVVPRPDVLKRHLDAFAKRWRRAFGQPLSAVWVREFQRRGAPHVHMLAVVPPFTETGDTATAWVSRAWYGVVGSGDERHLRAGTGIDWSDSLRMTDAHRAAAYFALLRRRQSQGLPIRTTRAVA